MKPMKRADEKEFCGECEQPMDMQFCPPLFAIKGCDAHYSHAFGKVIKSDHHLKDTIRKTNDTYGMKIESVGSDKMQSVKRQRKPYTL